jgi:hypothetical protein
MRNRFLNRRVDHVVGRSSPVAVRSHRKSWQAGKISGQKTGAASLYLGHVALIVTQNYKIRKEGPMTNMASLKSGRLLDPEATIVRVAVQVSARLPLAIEDAWQRWVQDPTGQCGNAHTIRCWLAVDRSFRAGNHAATAIAAIKLSRAALSAEDVYHAAIYMQACSVLATRDVRLSVSQRRRTASRYDRLADVLRARGVWRAVTERLQAGGSQ